MSKIVLNDVTNLNALSVINDNFDKLEQELQNKVLYRDNPDGEPNTLESDVDANGNSLYNIQDLTIDGAFTVQGEDVGAFIGQAADAAADAAASATAAANSATAASGSASAADASADAAAASEAVATTKAGEASSSASSASSSASTATTQAGIATTQAGIATTKASEASTSASNAATSASTATTQAGIATTKAGEANASAIAADASADAALISQNAAALSETNAGNSEDAAALSEASAAGYAASIDPATIVRLSGNQTIAGVKTFSSAPVLPNASINQAALAANVAGTGPAFSAYLSATQTVTANVLTKVVFDAENFDTNNAHSSGTFNPQVAGYYQINARATSLVTTTNTMSLIYLYKNGNQYARGNYSVAAMRCLVINELVYFNGTTDYLEVYGQSTNTVIIGDASGIATAFSASLVRAA